ncbi:MAG: DMT family transporter [Microcoleaceae cyanobacterium]
MNRSDASSAWQVSLVIVIGVVAISTGAVLVRLATNAAEVKSIGFSLVIAASRLTIAALLLSPTWLKQDWQLLQPQPLFYAGSAGICLAIHFATWITSLSYTSIVASTTLVTTSPIWVTLLSYFWLKEPLSKLTGFGILIAFLGGIGIGFGGIETHENYNNSLFGNGLALVGAWAVSFYLILGREAQRQGLKISSYIVIAYTVAALFLLPLPFLFETQYTGYPQSVYVYLVLMAILPQLIGHTSFNWAITHVSPNLVTLAILFEPVGSSILGFFLFKEVPSLTVLIGGMVILIGVGFAVLGSQSKA